MYPLTINLCHFFFKWFVLKLRVLTRNLHICFVFSHMLIHLVNTGFSSCRSCAHPPNSWLGLAQAQECFLQKANLYYIWSPILVFSSKDSFLWVVTALLSNLQILAVHFLQFCVFSNHFHFCLTRLSSGTVVGLSCSCSIYFVNVIALHREEIFWYCDSVDSWTWVDWVDSFHSFESECLFELQLTHSTLMSQKTYLNESTNLTHFSQLSPKTYLSWVD